MSCSLPMYPWPVPLRDALWDALRARLQDAGLGDLPDRLVQPADYTAHWLAPDLLLSQTCGYPAATFLAGRVTRLGAFHHEIEGCRDYDYSSRLLVRQDDPRTRLADFRGAVAACNESHSQSGYHALRSLIVRQPDPSPFFGRILLSGAHRLSARMVARGEADIAAIDCISAWWLSQEEPEVFARLRCIGHTDRVPGHPLISSRDTPPATVALLRDSLASLFRDPALAPLRQALRLAGFTPFPSGDGGYALLAARAAYNRARLADWPASRGGTAPP